MPIIKVEMLSGRTTDQKGALVRELADSFARTCGAEKEGIHVVIGEVERENRSKGGELMADRKPS